MIFYVLRSIPSDSLVRDSDYSTEVILDVLEIIIKWLQVSCNRPTLPSQIKILICVQGLGSSKRPSDLYDRFEGDLLRHKARHKALQQALTLRFKVSGSPPRTRREKKMKKTFRSRWDTGNTEGDKDVT